MQKLKILLAASSWTSHFNKLLSQVHFLHLVMDDRNLFPPNTSSYHIKYISVTYVSKFYIASNFLKVNLAFQLSDTNTYTL